MSATTTAGPQDDDLRYEDFFVATPDALVSSAPTLPTLPPLVPLEPLLTMQDAADHLGLAIQTLYQRRCEGRFNVGRKIGNRWRIRRSELEQWYDQQPA